MGSAAQRLLGVNPNRTGTTLETLRLERQLSLRELASLLFCNWSWLGNIEKGRRWPKDRGWAEKADLALDARGRLVAAWDADQRERAQAEATMLLVDKARKGSEALLVAPDGAGLDAIGQEIVDIATKARLESYDQTLARALAVRAELMRRRSLGAYTRGEDRDLDVALGRVCGVLSYLTLDLGQADSAKVHAEAAFRLGDRAGHDQLRAWARGTQALAYRFTKEFELARDAATDGLNYVNRSTGTTHPRLLCGLAASVANLGDTGRSLELLEQADRVREECGDDEIAGLFTFTPAKQIYYHGFSLMWATDNKTLRKSVRASEDALTAWKVQRSPGDEMLSTIYLASANARLGDLDAAIAAYTPVLQLPISAHFSWVRKRLNQLERLLSEHFPDSTTAQEARATLQGYIHAA